MIVTKSNLKAGYNLEIDYNQLMGDWAELFKNDLLEEDYLSSVMLMVHENYKNKKDYYPEKKDVFKCFKDLSLDAINVVIVNCDPRFNGRSNGLAFGNYDTLGNNFDFELISLFDDIELQTSKGLKLERDYTLSNWVEQGVFLLNTSLTGTSTVTDAFQWSRFIDEVLEFINDNRQLLIFCFIGDKDNMYTNKIDKKKHAVIQHDKLDIDALIDINNEIGYVHGENYYIKW